MAYAWKKGYHARVSAQAAAEVCSDLEVQDALSSENLVEVSRPKSAPLHGAFDWDDAVAGENWRKFQAGTIIRSLVIVSETDDGVPAEPVRAFFSIKLTEPNYESLHVIIRDQDKYADLLKTAIRELQAFSRKYRTLKELAPVTEAIDQLRFDLNDSDASE